MTQMDSLTGIAIADRCKFDEVLPVEWQRAKRCGRPVSLVLVAIDSFKSFNVEYGSAAGNECLRRVAQKLYTGGKRAGDLVARFGETEFALILPEINQMGAICLAESMRAAIANLDMPHAHSCVAPHVTVSLGVATRVPEMDSNADELLKLAEHALSQAKREGCDRVVLADHLGQAAA
ncbi:MAG: diguanylate cyclase [Gammaproteobacteria bacterium]